MKKFWLCFLISFFVIGLLMNTCLVSFAAEKPIRVRIATIYGEKSQLGEKVNWIAKELEKRSDGRFKCETFCGTAGGEEENLEDLLAGNIEMATGGSIFAPYCPEISVLELPFYGWQDREEARNVIRGYLPKFAEVFGKKGFYPVSISIKDFWGVACRKPITSLDDLKGAKFRSVTSDYFIKLTEIYGAVPVPLPYADAYMAFKTGVADGVVTSVTSLVPVNWHEQLKCFLDTRTFLGAVVDFTSKKWFDSLPSDLQQIFLEVGRDAEEFCIANLEKEYIKNKNKMLKAGVVFVQLDTTALREKMLAFRDEFMKKQGPEAYKFYKDWLTYVEKATGSPQY